MCVTTWSLPIDVRFFVSRVQGRCKPNAIELARIAEVQPVLANRLQRYDFFRKVVTHTTPIFSII